MNKDLFLKSSVAVVRIQCEEALIPLIINDTFLTAYIPSVEILYDIDSFDANITIKKSHINNIQFQYPEIIFEYSEFNPKDIISLAEYILERARQERGIICVHGASAIIDNRAVVCWGPATGMGKSSLALALSNDGYFYSDEKVLVDLKTKQVVGRIDKQYLSNDYWKKKFGNTNYFTHLNLSKDRKYDISLFAYALLCEQEEFVVDKWTADKFMWHLYEESARKIRGTSRTFFNRQYPAMSLDTDIIAKQRLKLINEFVKELQCIYFKGKCSKIVNYITSYTKKKHLS